MTRWRWLALGGVALLVVLALVLPAVLGGDDAPGAPAVSQKTLELQARAALAPCPAGLGPGLPDLTARCLGGGPAVRLRSPLTTGPTVLNVWASWCGPCTREVPALIRFGKAYEGRVALVGVNTADVDDVALGYAIKAGMRYPNLADPDADISLAFGNGVPKTILLDATGKVVHVQLKEVSYAELTGLVQRYLGVAP